MIQNLFERSLYKAKILYSEEFVEGNLIISDNVSYISKLDCFGYCDSKDVQEDIFEYDTDKLFPINTDLIGQYFGKVDLKLNIIFSNIDIFEFYKRISDEEEIHGIGYFEFDKVNLCYVVKKLSYYNDRVESFVDEHEIAYTPKNFAIIKIVGDMSMDEDELEQLIYEFL